MRTKRKLHKTKKAVKMFFNQIKKSYSNLKKKLKVIWACATLLMMIAIITQSCNVTRKVTTESSYYQKGDTTTTIVVKTIESYDATKKGL